MIDKSIRALNKDEMSIFAGAVMKATGIGFMPSFRDAIAIMRPYYDGTAQTIYVDKHARVGVGPWFFTLTSNQRASALLHEAMHVLNHHFARGEKLAASQENINISGDLEINSSISTIKEADVSWGLLPEHYNLKKYQTLEYYYNELGHSPDINFIGKESNTESSESDELNTNSDNSGAQEKDNSSQHNGNDEQSDFLQENDSQKTPHGCSEPTDERSEAADKAGISKASSNEQVIARNETLARVKEEYERKKNIPGNSGEKHFLDLVIERLSPPKVSWKIIFSNVLAKSLSKIIRGRKDYSYTKTNRRNDTEFILPSMIDHSPRIMMGIDTSGSMDKTDYQLTINEIYSIIKNLSKKKAKLDFFQVTQHIHNVAVVKNISDIKFEGGGGTDMSVAFKYVNNLTKKNAPDLFILATDAGTDWGKVREELIKSRGRYRVIILSTRRSESINIIKSYATIIELF